MSSVNIVVKPRQFQQILMLLFASVAKLLNNAIQHMEYSYVEVVRKKYGICMDKVHI